jgi:hypothetical protein
MNCSCVSCHQMLRDGGGALAGEAYDEPFP